MWRPLHVPNGSGCQRHGRLRHCVAERRGRGVKTAVTPFARAAGFRLSSLSLSDTASRTPSSRGRRF